METAGILGISNHSLAVRPLGNPRLLMRDLGRGRSRCRERCAKLGFREARRRLPRNFRIGCGSDRGLHTGIDFHARWTHPIRSYSNDRPSHVAVGDCFRSGKRRGCPLRNVPTRSATICRPSNRSENRGNQSKMVLAHGNVTNGVKMELRS
jgi:hypothetical protein